MARKGKAKSPLPEDAARECVKLMADNIDQQIIEKIKSATQTFWVVLIVQKWGDLSIDLLPFKIRDKMEDGCVGFLPIYPSLEEAQEAYPDAKFLQISTVVE